MAAIIGLGFSSCKKGEQGPQGTKGDPGAPAKQAEAFVFTAQQIPPATDLGYDEGSGQQIWSGSRELIVQGYPEAVDNGIVLVYFRSGADQGWHLGTMTTSRREENQSISTNVYTAVFLKDKIQVNAVSTSIFTDGLYLKDAKVDIKVIIIKDAAVPVVSGVNVNDVSHLEARLGLR
jgi:hypothetical protein